MIPWLAPDDPFPPVASSLAEPSGLLAASGHLDADMLVRAYAHGIFPWYSEPHPVLWWSPDPRMVLLPGEFVARRSLVRRLRAGLNAGRFEVHVDGDFEATMQACAAPRRGQDGTAPKHDLEHLRRRDARAKLAGHDGRRATLLREAHPRAVDEIAPVQHCRGDAQQEPERLLGLACPAEAEILLEGHPSRHEVQHRGPHADWRHRDGWNAPGCAGLEHALTRFEGEEVEPVHIDVGALQELVEIVGRHAVFEGNDFDVGIDVSPHDAI